MEKLYLLFGVGKCGVYLPLVQQFDISKAQPILQADLPSAGRLSQTLGLMKITPRIRRYNPGEESTLFNLYYNAVHQLANRDYSQEQIQAWAPRDLDSNLWEERIRRINPFVAELNDELVGYADLQSSGYIDHFFVSGSHARCGIGTALMNHILREARLADLRELTSDVSRTAQPFYEKFGFTVGEQRQPELRGVVIPNAFMRLRIV